ncbi:hypothetical protein [Actinomyces timonensis]|uniref:hypothetical protein n=1 Tax=Actinomyces timonensis TaxID=1288391 RepID=UPI0002F86D3C|nr:hypothetical protein [Actinomyces timonensis]
MRKALRPYVGHRVVVAVDGQTVRATLRQVGRDWIILADCEQAGGSVLDGLLIVPLPCPVQVVS